MYRFTVTANLPDHKPVVVFFCVLTLILCLLMSTFWAIVLCIIINVLAGVRVWYQIQCAHPKEGVIILEPKHFRFINENLCVQGAISAHSCLFGNSVWLYIKGFNKNKWLIISASSVGEQNFARLKRATLEAINASSDPK